MARMNRIIVRIVALLLVPCLVADPSVVAALSGPARPVIQATSSDERLAEQAIVESLLSDHRIDRFTAGLNRVLHSFGKFYSDLGLADQRGSFPPRGKRIRKKKPIVQPPISDETVLSVKDVA